MAVRFTLLMTLMPDADYEAVLAALLGDLVAVPWARRYRAPAATVVSTWRPAIGPAPLEQLREALPAAADAEHHAHEGDYRDHIPRIVDVAGGGPGVLEWLTSPQARGRPRRERPPREQSQCRQRAAWQTLGGRIAEPFPRGWARSGQVPSAVRAPVGDSDAPDV